MNRADKMLAVLQDGKPHTRHELQAESGFYLTNNAASELRARGLTVEQWYEGRQVVYRLALNGAGEPGGARTDGESSVPSTLLPAASSPSPLSASGSSPQSDPPPALPLFDLPAKPVWS